MINRTSGSWRLYYDELTEEWIVEWNGGWAAVAGFMDRQQASLIAAAPEMLDVLEETVYMRGIPKDDEDRSPYEKRLMAAIAKAKGETE